MTTRQAYVELAMLIEQYGARRRMGMASAWC